MAGGTATAGIFKFEGWRRRKNDSTPFFISKSVLIIIRSLIRQHIREIIRTIIGLKYFEPIINIIIEIQPFMSLKQETAPQTNKQSKLKIEEPPLESPNEKKKYSVVSYDKRIKLINLASQQGYSISRAARELGIKPSTGKFIVKCFRDEGKIMKKGLQNGEEFMCPPTDPQKLPSRAKMMKMCPPLSRYPDYSMEYGRPPPYYMDPYYGYPPHMMCPPSYYPPFSHPPEIPYLPELFEPEKSSKSEEGAPKKEETDSS